GGRICRRLSRCSDNHWRQRSSWSCRNIPLLYMHYLTGYAKKEERKKRKNVYHVAVPQLLPHHALLLLVLVLLLLIICEDQQQKEQLCRMPSTSCDRAIAW